MMKVKNNAERSKIIKKVYRIVEQIPEGKVGTYGQIAKIIRNYNLNINPRYVGYILHNNPEQERIPCHRVVDRNGRLAENYKFGGWRKQRKYLLKEGVVFRDNKHVDFRDYLR
jgi:methylated-DNA-protein-cysteine methyltransferase related protein